MPSWWPWGRNNPPEHEPAPQRVAEAPASPEEQRKKAIAAAIAAAVALVLPLTIASEGLRTKPYLDPAGIPTVCYGETQLELRVYSKDECGQMLRRRLAQSYAPPLVKCVKGITVPKRAPVFAALLDASYNAGPAAVCKSRMVQAINAGDWRRGCDLFPGWYITARGKVYPGLVKRRKLERELCLKGV